MELSRMEIKRKAKEIRISGFYVAPYVNLTLALLYLKISKGIGGNSIG